MTISTALLPVEAGRVLFDGFSTNPVLDHCEGLDIDPVDGSLWCGGESGQIFRIDLVSGEIKLIDQNVGGFTLGVKFAPGRRLIWLDAVKRQVRSLEIDKPGGVKILVDQSVGAHKLVYPNALDIALDGTIFFSDSVGSLDRAGGGIYKIDPDGNASLWSPGPFHFANGVAISHDKKWLYVAESASRQVCRIPFKSDGSAGEVERVWNLGFRVPDGVVIGPDKKIYVACYYPSVIIRLELDGSVTDIYEDPIGHTLSNPTNMIFVGNEAYVANLGRWHISAINMAKIFG
jgi:sugar lactone lactonase YvrE